MFSHLFCYVMSHLLCDKMWMILVIGSDSNQNQLKTLSCFVTAWWGCSIVWWWIINVNFLIPKLIKISIQLVFSYFHFTLHKTIDWTESWYNLRYRTPFFTFCLTSWSFIILDLQGSGIMWNAYDFPVFLLSESSTLTLQEVCTAWIFQCGLSVVHTLDNHLWWLFCLLCEVRKSFSGRCYCLDTTACRFGTFVNCLVSYGYLTWKLSRIFVISKMPLKFEVTE